MLSLIRLRYFTSIIYLTFLFVLFPSINRGIRNFNVGRTARIADSENDLSVLRYSDERRQVLTGDHVGAFYAIMRACD